MYYFGIPWHTQSMIAAFVNLIPVVEQCSSTARIGPHHCGHRTGAVLSSDKHWHAELEHCLALHESHDSSTAVSAVTSRSGVRVTVKHCLMTQSLLPWKTYTECGKLRSSAPSTACQCSNSLSYLAQNLHSEDWLGLHGQCLGHLGNVSKALSAVLLIKARL